MKLVKKKPTDLSFFMGLGGVAKGVGQFAGLGVLTLQGMKTTKKVGDPIDKKDLMPGQASVYFVTEDSVTELITQLTKMRKDMKQYRPNKGSKKLEIVIDASNLSTNGHSKQRGKASRARTKR